MLHRLRQVNFVVNDLDYATGLYDRYLGMKVVRRHRAMDGQHAVLVAGDGTFVGLWQPDLADAESTVFRESRGTGTVRTGLRDNSTWTHCPVPASQPAVCGPPAWRRCRDGAAWPSTKRP